LREIIIMTNPNKRATLTSVAQAAGVSVSTASRVLNQNDKTIPISQKTKDKVLGVARELGYMPSMAARALRSGSTKTIGVLGSSPTFFLREGDLSDQAVSFVNEIMRGLINSTVERGYNLTLLTGAELKNVTEMELLGSFGMVDGMIVLNRDLSAEDLLAHTLSSYPKPLIYALDYQDDDEFVTAPDDLAGGELATRTLLERGHTKIAFIAAPMFQDIFGRRRAGWEKALRAAGLNPAEQLIVDDVSALTASGFMASGSTAAVCANMPCAEEFGALLDAGGVSVPDQVELIAFYHETVVRAELGLGRDVSLPVSFGGLGQPRYASIVVPLANMIGDGIHRLIDRIEGKEGVQLKRLFPCRMQYGYSCPEKSALPQ
jgi:LacI family transcriptional regulator